MNESNDKKNKSDENDLNFEKAVNKLGKIVEDLESGGLNLDKSLEKFVKGVELVKFCNQELNRAEEKIEKVLKEDDEFKDIVPFNFREENDGENKKFT